MKLRKYQINASAALIEKKRVYLLSDMGSGKTAAAWYALVQRATPERPFLIIAPKLVALTVWQQEFDKWARAWVDERFVVLPLLGTPRQRLANLKTPASVYLINYELTPWLARCWKRRFDGLVLDEISRLKTPNKARFRAVLPMADSANFVWALTGTPLSTSYLDLFGQFRMIDRGKALTRFITHYKQLYFYAVDPNGWKWQIRHGGAQAIEERIAPLVHHITPGDQLKVAPTFTNEHWLDLDRDSKVLYKEYVKEFMLNLPKGQVIIAENAAVLTGKLSQFTGGGAYDANTEYQVLHDIKYNALDELLEDLGGQPTLIVYAFRGEAETIMSRHKGGAWLSGGSNASNMRLIERWNLGQLRFLLIHPSSCAHGLNLQSGGHHIVWFGLNASLELYQQLNARLPRPGQKAEHVFIHHILTRATFDAKLIDILADRDATQDRITDAVKVQLYSA